MEMDVLSLGAVAIGLYPELRARGLVPCVSPTEYALFMEMARSIRPYPRSVSQIFASRDQFDALPLEILLDIGSYLSIGDRASLALVIWPRVLL